MSCNHCNWVVGITWTFKDVIFSICKIYAFFINFTKEQIVSCHSLQSREKTGLVTKYSFGKKRLMNTYWRKTTKLVSIDKLKCVSLGDFIASSPD